MDKLISIIVPVYKVEQYLRTCIDSVFAQTYTNWEMVLVDDGSPDGCPAICDEYAQRDSRVTVLHKKNGGLSSARNAALDCPPRGEYITFLDSDDFWHPNYLRCLLNLSLTYHADMVQCDFIRGEETSFPVLREKSEESVHDNHTIFLSGKANVIVWGKLYKAKLFDGIRMPVGLYNEDDWTSWKLYYRATKIVVTNRKLYYYTVNHTSTMARLKKKPDLRFFGAYDERIAFFQKSGERDLEHCSRLQLCKSLVLTYNNKMITREEKAIVKNKFNDNWEQLKGSPYIPTFYKILFFAYWLAPGVTSKLSNQLHK